MGTVPQPVTFCCVKDHLGSTRMVVNEEGTLVEAVSYYAYGAIDEERSMLPAGSETAVREKFTGKEFDLEGVSEVNGVDGIRLDYFGARYYDPEVGVFAAADPWPQFWCEYSYAGGNPIRYTDPSGKRITDWELDAQAGGTFDAELYELMVSTQRGLNTIESYALSDEPFTFQQMWQNGFAWAYDTRALFFGPQYDVSGQVAFLVNLANIPANFYTPAKLPVVALGVGVAYIQNELAKMNASMIPGALAYDVTIATIGTAAGLALKPYGMYGALMGATLDAETWIMSELYKGVVTGKIPTEWPLKAPSR